MVAEDDVAGGYIDIDDFAQQRAGIFLFAKHEAQRRRDFSGRKAACGYLIKQRLEQMEIAAVD